MTQFSIEMAYIMTPFKHFTFVMMLHI